MRKNYLILMFAIVFMSIFMCSCSVTRSVNYGDRGRTPNENESVIIVQRENIIYAMVTKMNIYLNGELRLTLGNGDEGTIIVPNGEHVLYAEINSATRSELVSFTANSNRITFSAKPEVVGVIHAAIELIKILETPM
ncbi:MAG: hypothetical protein FWG98_08870 [Candidatus Cloacimonetes bacterium]|nr:hypothetical protein [Candidatus Cloacimonadota bacterium]